MARESRPVVVFDFDGTLAATWRDIAAALNATQADAGLPLADGPEVRFWIGNGVMCLLERAIPESERSPASLRRLYEKFQDHYDAGCLNSTETYSGILECLDQLQDVELAVLSNQPARFLNMVIDGLDLKRYFRVVLGGDSGPERKPHPAAMSHLLEQMGRPAGRLWMVGDSAGDIETGRSVQAPTNGCTWGLRGREELREAGADHLINHPDEIPALIFSR